MKSKPASKRITNTAIASPSVSQLVRVKGGYELRAYSSYSAALAAGLNRKIARKVFHKTKDLCKGVCVLNWQDGKWCSSLDCKGIFCECRLYKMWKDKNGKWHDDDMGKRDKKNKLPFDWFDEAFYRCSCVRRPLGVKKTR